MTLEEMSDCAKEGARGVCIGQLMVSLIRAILAVGQGQIGLGVKAIVSRGVDHSF